MFGIQLAIGAVMICVTVVIHAVALDRLLYLLERIAPYCFRRFRLAWKIPLLVVTVLGTFLSHIVQMWIWAVFYLLVTDFQSLEEALYFSTSTFSTLGFGDIVLDENWRLISTFQSANGFMLFGWSTAFIFEVMSKLYRDEKITKS